MKIYRCTMESYSPTEKRWVPTDLEGFDRDKVIKSATNLQGKGWSFKSWNEFEATENQIRTGKYLGMI